MLVVNLFAGACAGKSTTAAGVFSKLKKLGYQCEYVTEFAKDLVYDESYKVMSDQIYIFGVQQHRLRRCLGKTDIVIMDSPLLLSTVYSKEQNPFFNTTVMWEMGKYKNLNFFLVRPENYSRKARIETKERAIEIDKKVLTMLERYYDFITLKTNKDTEDVIVKEVLKVLA